MSYQVLARKWRPRRFEDMAGQGHVLRALVNALDHQRLHHAYLFTGTRGVGKTTVARIFAKALNCETGISSRPCGQCQACREIDAGRFVDLIEVDAASRTKVEDTRELLENVQYAPGYGRFKVYLIDEVHMLSGHSFNALLKTLEEPPPHVKFLLATTDPQRLPVTVLSRCLQFNLKRLPAAEIEAYLATVTKAEKVAAEPAALRQLAAAADGSMRDGLSLLDQAIAFGGGAVKAVEVGAMLGTLDRAHVLGLLGALAAGEGAALLDRVAEMAELAADFEQVLADMLSLLQRIAVVQVVPAAATDDDAPLRELARLMAPEEVQLYYQIALLGRRDLGLAPEPRSAFEMILLRMLAFRPETLPAEGGEAGPAPPPVATAPAPPRRPAATEAGEWPALLAALRVQGVPRQLAGNCVLSRREGDSFHLTLAPAHASLRSQKAEERLQQALAEHLGRPVKLSIVVGEAAAETPAAREQRQARQRQAEAVAAIEQDEHVKAFQERFGARVVPDSIKPIEPNP